MSFFIVICSKYHCGFFFQELPEGEKDPSHNVDKAGSHVVETLICNDSFSAEPLQVNEFPRMLCKKMNFIECFYSGLYMDNMLLVLVT